MTVSSSDILKLRRMINEPTPAPYTDDILSDQYIVLYPLTDSEGRNTGDDSWTEAYDLNAAACDVWSEKASLVATYYDFQADGGRYTQSQLFDMAMQQSRYYGARRKVAAKDTHKYPRETTEFEDSSGLIYDEEYFWWRVN